MVKKRGPGRPPGSKNKRGRPKGSGRKGFAATLANINALAKQLEKALIKAVADLAKGVM